MKSKFNILFEEVMNQLEKTTDLSAQGQQIKQNVLKAMQATGYSVISSSGDIWGGRENDLAIKERPDHFIIQIFNRGSAIDDIKKVLLKTYPNLFDGANGITSTLWFLPKDGCPITDQKFSSMQEVVNALKNNEPVYLLYHYLPKGANNDYVELHYNPQDDNIEFVDFDGQVKQFMKNVSDEEANRRNFSYFDTWISDFRKG